MRFELKLQSATRPEWKNFYIDYTKLKQLLRERDTLTSKDLRRSIAEGAGTGSLPDADKWTDEDEAAFKKELLDVQLDKVNKFQNQTAAELDKRCDVCEKSLTKLSDKVKDGKVDQNQKTTRLRECLDDLDSVGRDINELERYSRINYTGFVKAAKKHDRKRGAKSRIGPLLQERVTELKFNAVDYSPLIRRLSALYDFIRQTMPPEVEKPQHLIKDAGPVQVEAKVWLANQRTFIKWQHVAVLLASLSLGLFNAAGPHNPVAFWLALVYTGIAIFAGVWGWAMYNLRSRLIRERSGRDFDNILGPMVVCISLAVALCVNFGFKYAAAKAKHDARHGGHPNATITTAMSMPAQTGVLLDL